MARAPDGNHPVHRDLGLYDRAPGLHVLANLFVIDPGGGAGADQRVHKVLVNQCESMGQLAMH